MHKYASYLLIKIIPDNLKSNITIALFKKTIHVYGIMVCIVYRL